MKSRIALLLLWFDRCSPQAAKFSFSHCIRTEQTSADVIGWESLNPGEFHLHIVTSTAFAPPKQRNTSIYEGPSDESQLLSYAGMCIDLLTIIGPRVHWDMRAARLLLSRDWGFVMQQQRELAIPTRERNASLFSLPFMGIKLVVPFNAPLISRYQWKIACRLSHKLAHASSSVA